MIDERHLHAAILDFRAARQRAGLQRLLARLTGRSIDLLPYDEVSRRLRPTGSAETGLKEIRLEAIVGSVGRASDFTRDFLPRRDADEQRWARVRAAAEAPGQAGMPPIHVYQIGEAYFVIDGHHRVSVARQLGAEYIQAYVTHVSTKAPLSADVTPEEVILRSEYAGFMERTRLDESRPDSDLNVSEPGAVGQIEQHILQWQEQSEREGGRMSPAEAAVEWHDAVYQHVVGLIREVGLARDFPMATEADLYLLVSEHRSEVEAALGWRISPETGAATLAAQQTSRREPGIRRAGRWLLDALVPGVLRDGPPTGGWRRGRTPARYSDRLIGDILVPLSGEPAGWNGLQQAIAVARRERAAIHGLHVVPDETAAGSEAARSLAAEFEERCRAAGIDGRLALEVGQVTSKITERAALVDLVVPSLSYPPGARPLERLGSGFAALIRRSPRPILAVPAPSSRLERVLLAYDDSAKSREALFVVAYMAEAWRVEVTVVSVIEGGDGEGRTDRLQHAREYLAMHEIEASILTPIAGAGGPDDPAAAVASAILAAAEEVGSDLIVAGGYGAGPIRELVVGSTVDHLLRESRRPTLICR